MSAVARRYARAAVAAADEKGGQNEIDALVAGLTAFLEAFATTDSLRELVNNPALRESRDGGLSAVMKKLGFSGHAERLVMLLAHNDRMEILEQVAADVVTIADERAGRLRAKVTSAIPLTEGGAQRLAKALEKRFARPVVLSARRLVGRRRRAAPGRSRLRGR
jgi:F-type H+-transporting ATPase subunit delta